MLRSFAPTSPFQQVEGVNAIRVCQNDENSDYKAHKSYQKMDGFGDGSGGGNREGGDLLDI